MSRRTKRLTPARLKAMILEEVESLKLETLEQGKDDSKKVTAEEVPAEDLAGSLEKDIDYMKALKIHEARLMRRVRQIKEAKNQLRRRIAKKV